MNRSKSRTIAASLVAGVFLFYSSVCESSPIVIIDTYNTAGTTSWIAPVGVFNIQVECWGGGGAGGGGAKQTAGTNTSQNGGGGGGGAYAKRFSVPVTLLQSYTVTIPAAAVSGTNGIANGGGIVNGGAVTFVGDSGVTTTAAGGTGGKWANSGTSNATNGQGGGAGGTIAASVGDVTFAGGNGSAGNTGSTSVPGSGGGGAGDASAGGNAVLNAGPPSTTTAGLGGLYGGGDGGLGRGSGNGTSYPGLPGANAGGGGAGAKNCGNSTTYGGTGGLGQIILSYIAPLRWNTGDGDWDTGTANWLNVQSNTVAYEDGVNATPVLFDDTAGASDNPTVTLDSTFSPLGVTMNSTLHDYTISGSGEISGSTQLMLAPTNTKTLTLGTANTYTGATTVSGGTLSLTGSLTGSSIAVNGNGVFSEASSGVIAGGVSFTHNSTGTSTLAGANTHTGATTVNAGTLSLTGSLTGSSIAVNGNSVLSEASSGVIAGGVSFTHNSTGTSTLAGANTYTGATTVNAGTLVISGSPTGNSAVSVNTGGTLQLDYTTNGDSKINDSAILTLGGGTLDLIGGTHTEVVASTTLTAGTASSVTSSTTGSVLQMNSITRGAGASITFGASGIATTDNTNTNGILGFWATIGGVDWAANSTDLPDGLITAPAYTDVQRQTAGAIADDSASNVRIVEGGGTNNITLGAATTTINSLNQSAVGGASAATIDPAGQALRVNAILVGAGAGALTIGTGSNNGTLSTATAGGDLALVNNTANALTINSVIADNSTSSLTKAGTGPLGLNGANSYAGGTTLEAGTLTLGNASALGTGTLTISGGSLDSSVVDLVNANVNAQAWNVDFTFVGTQNLNLGTGAVTMSANRQVTVAANALTVGGAIGGGAVGLTKAGAGTLVLAGENTYTGGTTIAAGTLQLSGAGTPGAAGSSVAVSSGALLDLNGTNQNIAFTAGTGTGTVANNSGSGTSTLTLAGTATIDGSLVIIKDYTTTPGGKVAVVIQAKTQPLNNLNTYSGGTTVNDGAFLYLNSANPNGAGTGTIYLPAAGTGVGTGSGLIVDGATYANDITGAGYVHNNSNSGSTVVTTTFTGNLNTSGPFIFRAGTGIVYNFAGNGTTSVLSGVIGSTTSMVNGAVATGSIIKSGTGTLTLSGANAYTGTTTVSGGELYLTNWSSSTLGTITVAGATTPVLGISGSATYNLGTGGIYVGSSNNGTVNQTGGTVSITATAGNGVLVGNGASGAGIYNLSGGTLQSLYSSAARGVMLGVNSNTAATFNLSGAGILDLSVGELAVGRDDAGVTGCTAAYYQTGGAATVKYLSIGGQSGSTGTTATFSVTGGTFTANNTFQNLAGAATSSATITLGGSAQVTLPAFPTATRAGAANITFDFTTGYLSPAAASPAYMTGLTNAYLTANGVNFNVPGGNDITVAQVLRDAPSQHGTLTKSGAGMLTLTGANSYTGDTTISGGVLSISYPYLDDASTVTISIVGGLSLNFADSSVVDLVGDLWLGTTKATPGMIYNSGNTTYITGAGNIKVAGSVGDTNQDGVVDAADFITLKKNFGTATGAGVTAGDFNASGTVNWADLNILTNGMAGTGGAPAVTPEPATLGLLMVGALAVLRRRRK
jgi:autotransporter-associated beta strand protein